jgi:hypothetical protein
LPPGGCWTLLLTGPKNTALGILGEKEIQEIRQLFLEHGQHPCE